MPAKLNPDGSIASDWDIQLTGSNLQEQLTETNATAGTVTFADFVKTIEIYNTDSVNSGLFTVNGITVKVPPGKVFKSVIGGTPSKNVTVTGATTYILSRYV